MIIQNKKGQQYEITQQEWEVISNNGNAHKYAVIEDDAPVEVKQLREKKKLNKK